MAMIRNEFTRALPFIIFMMLGACVRFEPSDLDVSEGGIAGLLLSAATASTTTGGGSTETLARFAVVGQSGLGAWSDDGSTWTVVDITSNSSISLFKVIWTGTRFVAVGYNTSTFVEAVYTSTTGKTWTASTIASPCGGAFTTLEDVVLGNGRLMAVGALNSGAACAQTSTDDGLNWAQVSTAGATFPFQKVAYDGSVFLAALTNFTVGVQSHSSNGTSTFAMTSATATGGGGSDPVLGELTVVGTTVVWAGSDAGLNADSAITPNSGNTWTPDAANIFGGTASYPRAIVPDSGLTLLVAVGDSCVQDTATNLTTLNWSSGGTAIPACSGVNFRDMIYETGSSTWYAIGQKSGMALWSTADGSTWNEVANNSLVTPNSIASSQ